MIIIQVTNTQEYNAAYNIMQHELLHNCNISGYDFNIEDGEYLGVEGCDGITATQLYRDIINELDNQQGTAL